MTNPEQVWCANIEDHTPQPEGYIQWYSWAKMMSKTHRQDGCGGCGRYAIWVPRDHHRSKADGE